VCKSKAQGGLGLLDLEIMNKDLLAKWLVRFNDPTVEDKWKDILIVKYYISMSHLSPFWATVLKHKDLVDLSFNKHLGKGNTILFWIVRWHGECVLFSIFPHLYFIAINPKITVAVAFSAGKLHIEFKR
jgi:hypothetical protein